jgi:hypothetical protein
MRFVAAFIIFLCFHNAEGQTLQIKEGIITATTQLTDGPQGSKAPTTTVNFYKNSHVKKVILWDLKINSIHYSDMTTNQNFVVADYDGTKTLFYPDSNKHKTTKPQAAHPPATFTLLNDSAKIAGFTCLKALRIRKLAHDRIDTMIIWYAPDVRLDTVYMYRNDELTTFQNEHGLMLKYEMPLYNAEKDAERLYLSVYTVTNIDVSTPVKEEDFKLPEDLPRRPLSDRTKPRAGVRHVFLH